MSCEVWYLRYLPDLPGFIHHTDGPMWSFCIFPWLRTGHCLLVVRFVIFSSGRFWQCRFSMSSSSSALRARKFSDSLAILRNRLNRACRSLYSRLSSCDQLLDFENLFQLCTQSSFLACKIIYSEIYLLIDDFPSGFLFYMWLQNQGESWIQKLLRTAEKVFLFLGLSNEALPFYT